jgi:hypothetical protein
MERETSTSKLGKVYPIAEIKAVDKANHEELRKMFTQGANKRCADCNGPHPNWASCNLGIFICVNCAQLHRGMGTHISKVKSCMGTYLWHPDEMEVMRSVGNEASNKHYLALNPSPDYSNMRKLVDDKYVKQLWVRK